LRNKFFTTGEDACSGFIDIRKIFMA